MLMSTPIGNVAADGFHLGAAQTGSLMKGRKRKSLESAMFQSVEANDFLIRETSDIEQYGNHKKAKLIEYKSGAEAQTDYGFDTDSDGEYFNHETLSKRKENKQKVKTIDNCNTEIVPKIIRTCAPGRYPGIITRSSPCSLRRIVALLNEDQRLAVASMGLEGILDLTKIPSKLGYWPLGSRCV